MRNDMEEGYSIKPITAKYDHNWKVAYAMELLRITHEADAIGEATGEFVEAYYPEEEEFRAARKTFHKNTMGGSGIRNDKTYNLHIPNPYSFKRVK